MSNYLEIIFRTKFRLLALILVLPLAFAAVDLYLWRSYSAAEVVWVPDPSTYGQNTASALGFDPYSTVSQNFSRLFSNLLGSENFDTALLDRLSSSGAISNDRDRVTVLTSLNQLAVTPGRASASSSGSGAAAGGSSGGSGDHIVSIKYVCAKRAMCLAVVSAVLDVFRSTYVQLKAKASADSLAIYQAQLAKDQASVASITDQIQKYIAGLPKTSSHSPSQQVTDPVYSELQHELETAQKAVDVDNAQIATVNNLLAGVTAMFADITVIDGAKVQQSPYFISGMASDNVKSDAIALAGCLAAALVFVLLVAFLDRTVRDPHLVTNKVGIKVIAISDFQGPPSRFESITSRLGRRTRATAE